MAQTEPRVFIVDDDDAVRDSLLELLDSVGLDAVAFSSAQDFLESATPDLNGVLVLDIRMPGMSGLELQRALAAVRIRIPTIFITGHGDVPMAVEAMKSGAVEFLQKPFRDQELLDCIQQALSAFQSDAEHETLKQQAVERLATLTPREREVLGRIVDGKSNKVIAYDLDISQRTVENHRANLLQKMGARNTADLVRIVSYTV